MTDHFLARMAGPKWKDVWQLAIENKKKRKQEDTEDEHTV